MTGGSGTAGRPPTIKDVAREAGVAWSTVGNVIRGDIRVSDETRGRVIQAIEKVGYRPSQPGRQLRRGRSDLIALAVPLIDHPYFSRLAHVLMGVAEARGYRVFVDDTGGVAARELEAAAGYPGRGIDGVILSALSTDEPEIAAASGGTPLVLLGEHVHTSALVHVGIDNVESAADATRHLLARGRRRMVFVGSQPNGPRGTSDLRIEGFLAALQDAGLSPAAPTIPADEYSRESGEVIGTTLADHASEIDAVVCANDLLAIGVLRGLRRRGVRVPDEMAVLGWDDMDEGRYTWPTLTSVAHDIDATARISVESIISRLQGGPVDDTRQFVVRHTLKQRESTTEALDGRA